MWIRSIKLFFLCTCLILYVLHPKEILVFTHNLKGYCCPRRALPTWVTVPTISNRLKSYIQLLRIFLPNMIGQRQRFKKIIVNVMTF